MSKMAEIDMEIREALTAHTGPGTWLSCIDIAKMIGVPEMACGTSKDSFNFNALSFGISDRINESKFLF